MWPRQTKSPFHLLVPVLAELMTLEDVGDLLGITRERVRQLSPGRVARFHGGPPRVCSVDAYLRRRVREVLGGPDGLTNKQLSLLAGSPVKDSGRKSGRSQTAWEVARSWILAAAWIEGASLDDLAGFLDTDLNGIGTYLYKLRSYGYPFPRRSSRGGVWLEGPLAGRPVGVPLYP